MVDIVRPHGGAHELLEYIIVFVGDLGRGQPPNASNESQALLYHTSCQRMADVVSQIFQQDLQAPTRLPQQLSSKMTPGESHRRFVDISYDDCKAKVEEFGF